MSVPCDKLRRGSFCSDILTVQMMYVYNECIENLFQGEVEVLTGGGLPRQQVHERMQRSAMTAADAERV